MDTDSPASPVISSLVYSPNGSLFREARNPIVWLPMMLSGILIPDLLGTPTGNAWTTGSNLSFPATGSMGGPSQLPSPKRHTAAKLAAL